VTFAHFGVSGGRNIAKPRGFQEADLEPEAATKYAPVSVVQDSTIFIKQEIKDPYRSVITGGQRLIERDEIEH
jgi:hypothetical protein